MFPKQLHRLLVVIILQFFVPASQYAQAPTIEWSFSYGGSSSDICYGMDTTADGGCILVGKTGSNNGDVTGFHGGVGDFWIVKLNATGSLEWQKCFGGSGWDQAQTVKQTTTGDYVVAGFTTSTDGDITSNNGFDDIWVIKINSLGDLLWQKTFGGSSSDRAYQIEETDDGNYVIAGMSSSEDGDVTYSHGNSDFWVLKITSEGELLWQSTYGSPAEDMASSIKEVDNGFIVAGYCGGNGGNVTGFDGVSDFWIIKVDNEGNLIWQHSYGGSDWDEPFSISTELNNKYVITGLTWSTNGDVLGYHGGLGDVWTIITDTIGNLISQKCSGGLSAEYGFFINSTSDGNLVTTGVTLSNNDDVSGNNGLRDLWLYKSDTLLNIIWQKCIGGTESDYGNSIIQKGDGSFIVSGYSNSINGDVIGNHGDFDFWAVKLSAPCVPTPYFADLDNDSYGDISSDSSSCETPIGYVTDSTDCNDTNPDIHPLLFDICNSIDDNCNGLTDEDAVFQTYFADVDGDTYGNPLIDSISCSAVIGFVENDLDCNDADAVINPDALELCNSIDDNCNTIIDEGLTIYTFYLDADGDTYGDPTALIDTCAETVTGYVSNNFDCNDSNASIYPGAEEICNYLDDDCDGVADDNLAYTWQYQDADEDNYGNVAIDTLACLEIPGYITDSTDCNDLNPNIYPGASEILNGLDDDCDGLSDEGLSIINNQVIQLSIHPIPATDHIIIDYPASTPTTLNIYTSSGAIIYQNPHWTGQAIDISNFPPAMYYLQLLQPEQVGYGCFVKE